MTAAHTLILAVAACLILGLVALWWLPRARPRPADDTEALLSATAEPERDHTARPVPLPDADTGWLIARAAMLDREIHRGATRLVLLGDQRDRITAELCLRGHAADGAADLQTYLSEETRER